MFSIAGRYTYVLPSSLETRENAVSVPIFPLSKKSTHGFDLRFLPYFTLAIKLIFDFRFQKICIT